MVIKLTSDDFVVSKQSLFQTVKLQYTSVTRVQFVIA